MKCLQLRGNNQRMGGQLLRSGPPLYLGMEFALFMGSGWTGFLATVQSNITKKN